MTEVKKIDSNITGLRIAKETSLGNLPALPTWYPLEPNSFSDFGGQLSLVARDPINPSRQRKKGVITDLDASGGFEQDLTFTNLSHLWPGLFLAKKRQKAINTAGSSTPADDIVSIGTSDDIVLGVGGGAKYQAGDLIWLEGFATASNNGLKVVESINSDTLTVAETLAEDAAPADGATIKAVGHQFGSGELTVARTAGSLPTLVSSGTQMDSFGFIPGETIYIGGDTDGAIGDRFTGESNNGFARIAAISATTLTLDKTSGGADGTTEMVTEAGGTKTVRIFFGDLIRNETSVGDNFDKASYTIVRLLGAPNPQANPTEIQSEALTGAVLGEFTLNIRQADKIMTEWSFTAINNLQRSGSVSDGEEPLTEAGTEVSIPEATAYNTSSDFSRMRLAIVRPTIGGVSELAAPTPLFAYVTEATINVSNNVKPDKAVSILGGFDVTLGSFQVGGSINAYFSDVAAVKAVRDNADVTLDIAMVKDFGTGALQRKAGLYWDIPLIALGDGRLNVTKDEAIMIPLETEAAEYEPFGHTLVLQEFYYLPNNADS